MEATCAALIATYLSGMQPAQLDKTAVYDIPASAVNQLSIAERTTARACAVRLGIRYRIVKSETTPAAASLAESQ
jgi:hypothetical protein